MDMVITFTYLKRKMKKILITGVAGFIGYHVAKKLIKKNLKLLV